MKSPSNKLGKKVRAFNVGTSWKAKQQISFEPFIVDEFNRPFLEESYQRLIADPICKEREANAQRMAGRFPKLTGRPFTPKRSHRRNRKKK